MLKKSEHENKKEEKILRRNGGKLYEKPQVKEYGSIEKLTQGASGNYKDLNDTKGPWH